MHDVETVNVFGSSLGLKINIGKCEIIHKTGFAIQTSLLRSFKAVNIENASLLGAPLFPGPEMDDKLTNCCTDLAKAIDRLESIGSHDALVLLRSSFSAPKMQYILRCSPCLNHPTLSEIDELLRSGICRIINITLNDTQWLQASLPVRDGGLGVRKVSTLALSAYLASAASTMQVQDQILSQHTCSVDSHTDAYRSTWSTQNPSEPLPLPQQSSRQCSWDKPEFDRAKEIIWNEATDIYNKSRLLAVSGPHSGDWLHALPIGACGLRLDDEAVRVAIGLRLGVELCQPHDCPCGKIVDARGLHGLSCRLAFGRMARHQSLNDTIFRSIAKAGIPVVKEPLGLSRTDGRRPDGLTLVPWRCGKSLVWDVTVVDTLAESYINSSAQSSGAAAQIADERKTSKYSFLPQNYLFQPIAFETLGPINSTGSEFLSDLGGRLEQVSGDARERSFLYQRLSVIVQRFNAVAFRGSFVCADTD
jgi:hypothetical protein